MEFSANAVTAIFAHHRTIVVFGVFLYGVAYIAQAHAGLDQFDADFHAFVTDTADTAGDNAWGSHGVHFAGITVKAVFDYRNVDIDNVAFF